MLRAIVLGSAAGGGVPQWNSGTIGCVRAREGDPLCSPRTQASIALTGDGHRWFVVNASPDIRAQFAATPALHPRSLRDSPLAGVVLTGAEIDAVAGLLTLRERQAFTVYATAPTFAAIAANPIFGALTAVTRVTVAPGQPFALGPLTATLLRVPGKVPLYLEGDRPNPAAETDDTVGLRVTDGQKTLCYVPGCARVPPDLLAHLASDALFFDATLWSDDEMTRLGVSDKTGARMGHISVCGPDGSLAALRDVRAARKYFTHLNNTNPLLSADSAERAEAARAGWDVAYDGMDITL